MADLYKNKYRITSFRLQSWDYSSEGFYFITICTADRRHFFGEVINKKMQLTELGKIAESEWYKTMELRKDMNLNLGEFVVMPNHIHGIIMIGKNQYNFTGGGCGGGSRIHPDNSGSAMHPDNSRSAMHRGSTGKNHFSPQSKNLASIIRGYKSAVTTFARKNNIPFAWQSLYWDNIIWSHESFVRISNYIKNNPGKWQDDRFCPQSP